MRKVTKTLVLILIITFVSSNVFAATIYAPDGRTAWVDDWAVSSYEAVGWYSYPVVTMYAPDGRSIVVSSSSVASWENVGWIDGRKTATIYASDGRTATVPLWQVASYKAVGWSESPVNYHTGNYYSGTLIPTYESVTGDALMYGPEFRDGFLLYGYYSNYSNKSYYESYIKTKGFKYFDTIPRDDFSVVLYSNGSDAVAVCYDYPTGCVIILTTNIDLLKSFRA